VAIVFATACLRLRGLAASSAAAENEELLKQRPEAAMPFVSVIMPTFNRANCITSAIASVLGQTITDLELIVVDDGSTDETAAVLRGISDARLRYLVREHQGVSATRNAGLAQATGAYLAFCDSDDTMDREALACLAAEARAHPEADVLYGDAYWENVGQVVPSIEDQHIPYVPGIATGTLFIKNRPEVRFDPSIRDGLEEWDLLLRLRRTCTFRHCPKTVLTVNRSRDDHLMGDKGLAHAEGLYLSQAVREILRTCAAEAPWLVILYCRCSALPTTFIALNHLRLFFGQPCAVLLDAREANPALAERLTNLGLPLAMGPTSLRELLEDSAARWCLSLTDDLLVTPLFRLPEVAPGTRYLPRLVTCTQDLPLRRFETPYQPHPVIVESFTAPAGDPVYDSTVFIAERAAVLATLGPPSVAPPSGADHGGDTQLLAPLLRIPALDRIV
jgi:hypothetical protein